MHVGTIARRVGIPHDEDPWGWTCGFYPGSHPREITDGTAPTFEEARADFEAAWRVFLSNRTEADFDEYRRSVAWTAWKYKMWDTGHRLPTQNPTGRSRCFCGADIGTGDTEKHVRSDHMETA